MRQSILSLPVPCNTLWLSVISISIRSLGLRNTWTPSLSLLLPQMLTASLSASHEHCHHVLNMVTVPLTYISLSLCVLCVSCVCSDSMDILRHVLILITGIVHRNLYITTTRSYRINSPRFAFHHSVPPALFSESSLSRSSRTQVSRTPLHHYLRVHYSYGLRTR